MNADPVYVHGRKTADHLTDHTVGRFWPGFTLYSNSPKRPSKNLT